VRRDDDSLRDLLSSLRLGRWRKPCIDKAVAKDPDRLSRWSLGDELTTIDDENLLADLTHQVG